jgi:hypothetical protein
MQDPLYTVGDLAFELERLQVSPDDFARVLQLAHAVTAMESPKALADVAPALRIGAVMAEAAGRFSGLPVGHYCGRAILAWPKTEREIGEERRGPHR